MATALEWLALPVREIRFPSFDLSEEQNNRALIFANMAYRAAVCHEVAHAVLGHLNALQHEQNMNIETNQRILMARQRETAADGLAMRLHVNSLPHPDMFITGLASMVYYIHATSLLRLKLMMLSRIIDTEAWTIKGQHPDPLHRIANLTIVAKELYGATRSQVLMQVHSDLEVIAAEIRQSHLDQCRIIREDTVKFLYSLSVSGPTFSTEPVTEKIQELLNQSPVGVVEALDRLTHDLLLQDTLAAVVSALPKALQRFLSLAKDQRTFRALNQVV